MTIPTNVEVIENEVAQCWIEENILILVEKATHHSLDNFREHRTMVTELTGGKVLPVLLYLKDTPLPDRQTREFVAENLQKYYSAVALVSSPELADESIRNFGLTRSLVPIRHFTDDWAAKEWLSTFND